MKRILTKWSLSFKLIFCLLAVSTYSQTKSFSIAFGSCDNQRLKNELWKAIDENHPVAWIWGGDNVYSDTEKMSELKENYAIQKNDTDYLHFISNKQILGTWDDHDYGLNDGGEEYPFKRESQQLLMDFLGTSTQAPERFRDGVYNSKVIEIGGHKVKIIILDSRFFRTAVTKAVNSKKRLQPNPYGQGTILGEVQWNWLERELASSEAQFNVIVSSIQFVSDQHGFECWGNFPHEINRLEKMIVTSKAKGTFIISGDRHIATFSSKKVTDLSYPLVDFTSSGLTHVYTSFSGEENPYQIGKVVAEKNFGLLHFDFTNNRVIMQIRGLDNKVLGEHIQHY